jgi:hypothetical protein
LQGKAARKCERRERCGCLGCESYTKQLCPSDGRAAVPQIVC